MAKITSNQLQFLDTTDNRKLEVYITSNLPTTQIYDVNSKTYSPNWIDSPLQLTAEVYLNSTKVTNNNKTYIRWFKKNGTNIEQEASSGTKLTIKTNEIPDSSRIMTYICEATYTTIAADGVTVLEYLTARQQITFARVDTGENGTSLSIKSTTVTYGSSDSASIQPSTWQSSIPVVDDGKYLWTRSIIDYTDDTIPDTVTYIYAKQGEKGDSGSPGDSITVSSIQYQSGASATTTPTGTWSNNVVSVSEGNYLWTKTTFSDGKVAYGVAKQGVSGKDGVGINSTTVDYGVSDSATVKPTTWQQDIPVVAEGKYLWTRTVIDYTDNSKADTVTYVYSKQGSKGDTGTAGTSVTVKSIRYQSGTSAITAPTGTWSDNVVAVAEGNYLWTQTTFSDNKVAYGVAKQGQKGDQGIQGIQGPKGEQGVQGPAGVDGKTSYFHIKYSANANGNPITETPSTYIGTYVDYIEADSDDYTKYTWSRFIGSQGEKGDQGIAGTNGVDGQTSYLHIAYATSSNGSSGFSVSDSVGKTYIGQYTDHTQADSTDYTKYKWTLIKGDKGDKGDQGVQGPKGNDGQQYYTWVKYADTPTSGMSNDPDGKVYIGLAYNKTTATESNTYADYTWSLIKGETGAVGPKGADGQQYYTWIKYADNASGANMSDSPSGKSYIGLAYNKTTSTESNVASDYTWALFKGDKGDTGVGIASTTVTYGTSDSSSTQPTSWQTTIPTVAEGKYLWTRTVIDYTDTAKADTVSYTYAKQGTKGDAGSAGSSVTVTSIQYQEGTSATTAPTGTWSNSVVSVADGKYLWTKTAFSDGKTAYGVAKQGTSGRGVSSISEEYYQSTSATTQSGGSWSTTVPTWVDGKYIWTRSVITYTDSTTSTTSPVCVTGQKGGIGGTGVGVSSVDVWYYQSTSTTALSGGSWSTTAPTWSDGKYVWTKTITTYTNNTTDETNAVCITGQKGSTGVGIKSVTEYYLATASSSGVTTSTSGWTTTIQTITVDKKYLWNYEIITYTNDTTTTTAPIIIGVFGNTGKGIKSVTEYYLATSSSSNVTTSTSGWTTTMQTLTSAKKYLWNYELITYTDDTTSTVNPIIIGVYGDQGVAAVSFQVYAPNGYLLSKELASLTLQTFAYEGSTAITSGATYQWSQLIDGVWTTISGATSTTYTVTQADVLKAKSYRCVMTYKGQTYTSTVTVQDKTDIYNSVMCISSNARGNNCYWVLYTLVYTDAEEIDSLLGPISINAPTSPMSGDYWYAVDETNASVQLKKYNGSSWVNSTDVQSLSYYWDIINNGSEQVPFGDHSKVQVVSCNDFTSTATLMCGVSNVEDGLLTQSSLSLTDASDPIISSTEPTGVIDGQIWIKPNNNGTYIMSIWDATNEMWVVGDMDTRTKVYTNKPSAYNVGDLWITASDTEHSGYLEGTLLRANTSSSTFNESHWSTTLKYDKDLDSIKETLNDLSQYVNITSKGLKIGAQSSSGEISPFTSLFTSTELAFYQNSDKLLTLANNQLTAPHIVVEDDLEVQGSISLGNLNLTIESNGSFSFAVSK